MENLVLIGARVEEGGFLVEIQAVWVRCTTIYKDDTVW